MEVLLPGKAIPVFLTTVTLYGYQLSGEGSDYTLHLQTSHGDFVIQPTENLSPHEKQNLETLLHERLSRTRGKGIGY
jgi:hypothetical protein